MNTYILLLRGINVGGKNALPMKTLVELMQQLGMEHAQTYIQSGNALFQSVSRDTAKLAQQLANAINGQFGFTPHIIIMPLQDLKLAIENNPFPQAVNEPASLHLGLMAKPPLNPDLNKLASIKKETEQFQLIGKVFYLHAPEGVGRSKLAAQAEKLLGEPMTDRNWKTVCKLVELAAE